MRLTGYRCRQPIFGRETVRICSGSSYICGEGHGPVALGDAKQEKNIKTITIIFQKVSFILMFKLRVRNKGNLYAILHWYLFIVIIYKCNGLQSFFKRCSYNSLLLVRSIFKAFTIDNIRDNR